MWKVTDGLSKTLSKISSCLALVLILSVDSIYFNSSISWAGVNDDPKAAHDLQVANEALISASLKKNHKKILEALEGGADIELMFRYFGGDSPSALTRDYHWGRWWRTYHGDLESRFKDLKKIIDKIILNQAKLPKGILQDLYISAYHAARERGFAEKEYKDHDPLAGKTKGASNEQAFQLVVKYLDKYVDENTKKTARE
jgi:hypothetical protein